MIKNNTMVYNAVHDRLTLIQKVEFVENDILSDPIVILHIMKGGKKTTVKLGFYKLTQALADLMNRGAITVLGEL